MRCLFSPYKVVGSNCTSINVGNDDPVSISAAHPVETYREQTMKEDNTDWYMGLCHRRAYATKS